MFGHHPHPQDTVVPNFVSVTPSIAQLAHAEESHTQSLNHSLTHSAYLMCPEPKLSLWKIFNLLICIGQSCHITVEGYVIVTNDPVSPLLNTYCTQ